MSVPVYQKVRVGLTDVFYRVVCMEDRGYLMQHSKQASHLALIDSADRNTALWPTASSFDVVFDTPFQNVYGIDLLSVNMPRTEYNVSSSRNVLAFSFGAPGAQQKHRVMIPEGDYSVPTIQTALNGALQGYVSTLGNVLSVQSLSAVTNSLVLACAEPFTLYLSDSSARLVLGFGNPVDIDSTHYVAPGWRPGGPDTITSVISPVAGATQLVAFQGATTSSTATAVGVTAQTPVAQMFTSSYAGACTSLSVNVSAIGSPPAGSLSWQIVDMSGTVIATGVVQPDTDTSNNPSVGTSTTTPTALVAQQQYVLELSHPGNEDASNCYVVYVGPTVEASGQLSVGGQAVSGSLVATINSCASLSSIVAPGLLDLTGERYIVMRCLEVETAINGSRAFEQFNAGVGVIQLGQYGYSNQTYDYSAYPPRTFQPLPNLFKLSLSFQKSDGSLYDLKGLNLQVLMLIRYLEPDRGQGNRSEDRLHPHYTPSIAQAQSRLLQTQIANDPRYYWS